MAKYKQIATGTIGTNRYHAEGDTTPDINGSITFTAPIPVGEKLMIAAWRKPEGYIAFKVQQKLESAEEI